MNINAFKSSLKETEALLKKVDLLKMKGPKIIWQDDVSQDFKNASLKSDYINAYKVAVSNYDFDFLLHDQSFFQFSYSEMVNSYPKIRYAFYQNPQDFFSYSEYLKNLKEHGIIDETDAIESWGEIFYEEYEQFLTEQQLNSTTTSIRYDVDQANYKPLVHSVSHMHFGNSNNIRVPCDKIMTPLKFMLFVINHIYYYEWSSFITSKNTDILTALQMEKGKCVSLDKKFWKTEEQYSLFLS